MKKYFSVIVCGLIISSLVGCSSSDSKKEEGAESAEVESAPPVDGNSEAAVSDSLPEDALGAPAAQNEATTQAPILDQEPPPPAPVEASDVASKPAPPAAETAPLAPPTEVAPVVADKTATPPVDQPKAVQASLQKVPAVPRKAGDVLLNSVYIARPGDTLQGISQKIYGANKSKELKKANDFLKRRSLKPGDKVYYNSPVRPTDDTKVLTWYEDNGIAPESYTAKSGDSLRKVSKDLLGYDLAWKEVWSTNTFESKESLDEGTTIRYWKSTDVGMNPPPPAPPPSMESVGSAPPPPPPSMEASMPPPPTFEESNRPAEVPPPPPPSQQAMNDMPPPPPMGATGETQAMNDIPPPPMDAAQPPPMPPAPKAKNKKKKTDEAASQGIDDDTMMMLGVVAAAAAGLAGFMAIRKRRKAKEAEQMFSSETQVG